MGEIVVQGDQVMDGYFRDPEATAAADDRGRWLHTGDMAVWDQESYVNIVDRKKEIIISGGENISSLEVEAAIQRASGGAGVRRGRGSGPTMGRSAGRDRGAEDREPR